MKRFIAAIAFAAVGLGAGAASADNLLRKASDASVTDSVARLVAAAESAGATVFATVDHGAGARGVGADIGESQLVIVGNPQAGTPVMERNRLAGLILPLHVLVYEDAEGKVWVAYEDIGDRLDDLEALDDDQPEVQALAAALDRLTSVAAGGAAGG
ncbi:MAG: DUF302 domain-containing protein [Paracoccus sp. (in: a-proteobacteria)]|uniref:DUF302 domain-containing protein n=1 Tax=Paracoccus sp. TaxID=267 RepID=UPI0026E0ECB9|nr:DUF302 domain-containing protein [Paracoccus sp. (in: a-proteobacteria)]MDO5621305.1 DUF302 domain-containing protein [Paracoccus sp. (in: a-proteobacteria)]